MSTFGTWLCEQYLGIIEFSNTKGKNISMCMLNASVAHRNGMKSWSKITSSMFCGYVIVYYTCITNY